MAEMPTNVFIVLDPNGKPWSDTVATTEDGAKTLFVRGWLTGWRLGITDIWHIWNAAKATGYQIRRLPIGGAL
jgi:hypothetical protein